ncbi:uncharacterized protein TM35_000341220 [Trypanosoma theileri]|uniref:Uncharacterized protein n=1 Tax=Trypanosoma theileri TaxID=67003 RepID=A0A1X0NMY6_9TRYP|nr:uncharacterized protein TM35_000341220 [Trypanosoma theileri]ORC85510.1 hypothetical protein TM35_000341220 [Trypanosoma theileri]
MIGSVTSEQYTTVKKIQRTLLGTQSTIPRREPLDLSSIGLINFLGRKEAKLRSLVRGVDISIHESLQPLGFLVEFMSFIVGGLTVEADKIGEAVCDTRKVAATLAHEIQRCEVELEYRHQYSGTNVTRALAQFYPTQRVYSSSAVSSSGGGNHLQELTQAISEDRVRLRETKSKLKALVLVQRFLWGSGNVPQEDVEHVQQDFGVTLAIRRFNHKLRDIMLPLSEEAQNSLGCLNSLQEFIAHVDIGLSAATEDLDICLVSLKKNILMQQEDSRVRRIEALRDKSSLESSSSIHFARPLERKFVPTMETEELSKLYCS